MIHQNLWSQSLFVNTISTASNFHTDTDLTVNKQLSDGLTCTWFQTTCSHLDLLAENDPRKFKGSKTNTYKFFFIILSMCYFKWLPTGKMVTLTTISWDGSMVTAPGSWSKGHGFKSPLKQLENFLLQCQLSMTLYFSIRSTPCVTTVARKRPQSFCQNCRWQVTDKYACTVWM